MGNDSKLGMIAGLAIVLAVALLAKVPAAPAPGPTANTAPTQAPESKAFSLTSRERHDSPARVVPFERSATR